MFHNPSVLHYYAEARHRADLHRASLARPVANRDIPRPRWFRRPALSLPRLLRSGCADAPPAALPMQQT